MSEGGCPPMFTMVAASANAVPTFTKGSYIIGPMAASAVVDMAPRRLPADYPFERLAVSEFLREVVPTDCLAYLRFLELLFPIHVTPKYLDKDTIEQEWRATLDWVHDKINPLALTIRCVMVHHHMTNSASSGPRLLALTEEGKTRGLRAHTRILCPLENFSRNIGMAGFDVQIAHYASRKPDKKRYLLRQFKQMGQFPVERWEILPDNISEFRNSSDNVDPRDGTWQIWGTVEPTGYQVQEQYAP
ncbi:hypothetical protein P885DRAFT_64082 [Corynascus similis CBS 632.67]